MARAADALRAAHAGALASAESSHFWWGGDAASQAAGLANLRELGPRVERWATVLRTWAERGARDDGTSYTPARWYEHGRELSDAMAAHGAGVVDASLLAVVGETVRATADELGDAAAVMANPLKWPLELKVAAGLVLAVLLAPYAGALVRR